MLTYALIAVGVIAALLILVVVLTPSDFRVSRSMKMEAPAPKVFEQVNDLHLMNVWNPWVKLDPNIKQTYEGAASGVGASYAWDGNNNVGSGRQTIRESRPHEFVCIKLEFFRPFAGVNEAHFSFLPDGNQTVVTWSLVGKRNAMMKVMGLCMSMDKMVGGQFEKGLADMKAIVEA